MTLGDDQVRFTFQQKPKVLMGTTGNAEHSLRKSAKKQESSFKVPQKVLDKKA